MAISLIFSADIHNTDVIDSTLYLGIDGGYRTYSTALLRTEDIADDAVSEGVGLWIDAGDMVDSSVVVKTNLECLDEVVGAGGIIDAHAYSGLFLTVRGNHEGTKFDGGKTHSFADWYNSVDNVHATRENEWKLGAEGEGRSYTYDYEGLRFVFIDALNLAGADLTDLHTTWLPDVMSGRKAVVVCVHAAQRLDDAGFVDAINGAGNIQLVLAGHGHGGTIFGKLSDTLAAITDDDILYFKAQGSVVAPTTGYTDASHGSHYRLDIEPASRAGSSRNLSNIQVTGFRRGASFPYTKFLGV